MTAKRQFLPLQNRIEKQTTMPSYFGSGGFCGKHTSSAYLAGSRPDVGTQHENCGNSGVVFSTVSKPDTLSSDLEVVDPDVHAESSAVVQGEFAVSHGIEVASSGKTCEKATLPAYLARSQPGGVELVSRATYISRRNVIPRRSSVNPRRSKEPNVMRNASSLHSLRSAMKLLR